MSAHFICTSFDSIKYSLKKDPTFGEGTTEYVFMILSGYSSLIFEMRSVPIPDPVPPPRE